MEGPACARRRKEEEMGSDGRCKGLGREVSSPAIIAAARWGWGGVGNVRRRRARARERNRWVEAEAGGTPADPPR